MRPNRGGDAARGLGDGGLVVVGSRCGVVSCGRRTILWGMATAGSRSRCIMFLAVGLGLLGGWGGWGAVARGAVAGAQLPPAVERSVDFVGEVRPLFQRSCYSCHGPEKQKSGFRLDVKSEALKGGEHGVAIVPGRSAESRLVQWVGGLEEGMEMPSTSMRLARS